MRTLTRMDAFFDRALVPADQFFLRATRNWAWQSNRDHLSEEQKALYQEMLRRETRASSFWLPVLWAAMLLNFFLPDSIVKWVLCFTLLGGNLATVVVRQVWGRRRRRWLEETVEEADADGV